MANLSNINNKFLVTTGGDVGVGVTSPGSKLSIGGTTGSYNSGIGFQPTGTGARIYRTFIATDGSFRFDDVTAGFLTRLTIQAGGNVGIGTTSPQRKLHLHESSSSGSFISFTNDTTGQTITDGAIVGIDGGEDMLISIYENKNIEFRTGNTERMRIDSSGGVSITPTTSTSLFYGADGTNSYINFETNNINATVQLYAGYSSGGYFAIGTKDSGGTLAERMRIDSSGIVKINTTAVNARFRVDEGRTSEWVAGFKHTGANPYGVFIDTSGNTSGGYTLGCYTNTGTGLFLKNDGNVGIGTTSPQRLLHLRSTNEATGIFLERSANYGFVQYNQVVGSVETYHLGFVNNNTFSSDILVANESGNVGIGTASPQAKLSVVGSGENGGIFFNNSGAQEHRFYSSANSQFNTIGSSTPIWNWAQYTGVGVTPNYKMTLNNTGLGIGTTSPSAKLEVSGNIKLSTAADIIVFGSGGTSPAWSAPQIARIASYMTMSDYSGVQFGGYDGTSYGPRMIVLGTGNVGIGTTNPSNKLDVAGNVSLANYSGTGENQTILAQNSYGQMRAGIRSGTPYIGSISPLDFALYTGNSEKMRITNAGNVGIGTTSPDGTLHVVGKVNTNRIVSSNLIAGNIRSNLTTTTYLLLVDLNVSAGFSLVGELNAASYTTYNVSRIYIRKNYNATTGAAVITGIAKSGSNLSVVDISHSSGRFIAIKLTGDPEIDVMWTGYRLNDQFNSDGTIKILTSGVTENSVYASY